MPLAQPESTTASFRSRHRPGKYTGTLVESRQFARLRHRQLHLPNHLNPDHKPHRHRLPGDRDRLRRLQPQSLAGGQERHPHRDRQRPRCLSHRHRQLHLHPLRFVDARQPGLARDRFNHSRSHHRGPCNLGPPSRHRLDRRHLQRRLELCGRNPLQRTVSGGDPAVRDRRHHHRGLELNHSRLGRPASPSPSPSLPA